uniref:SDR family NAD(P)-dependent oxidoreductase n=1 Tax=Kitasatospora sp. MBT63 TaxID=1444768 RepID=UPI00053B8F28
MTDTAEQTLRRPLALVTGASSGIGFELAKQFADNGFDPLVTAEDPGLEGAAHRLGATGGHVQAVQADLRSFAGVETVYAAVKADGRPLAAAALNAGLGRGGAFIDIDLGDEIEIIDVNITST